MLRVEPKLPGSKTGSRRFPEAEDCEAEDSSRTDRDSNRRVEVDIPTEETYMTYETYIGEAERRGSNKRARYRGGNGRARGNVRT